MSVYSRFVLLVFLAVESHVIKNTRSPPASSSFTVEDLAGPAWQVYEHRSAYENKHCPSELCKSLWLHLRAVTLQDWLQNLLLKSQTRWHFYCPGRSFTVTDLPETGTRGVREFRRHAPPARGPPQMWFSAKTACICPDLKCSWNALTSGSRGSDGDLSPREDPCRFLCRSARCPSWRAVSGQSQRWAFLSHRRPLKNCVWVPLWRTSLWYSPSSGLVSCLLLDAPVGSRGDRLPLTLVALAGHTVSSWNVPSFLAALSFFLFFF